MVELLGNGSSERVVGEEPISVAALDPARPGCATGTVSYSLPGSPRGEPRRPNPAGDHYDAEVNRGSLNVGAFTAKMNQRWRDGWRLAHVFEQDDDTVFVWEKCEGA
jgi:hypothetical protein